MGAVAEAPQMMEPVRVTTVFATGFEVQTKGGLSEMVFFEDRYVSYPDKIERTVVGRVMMESFKLETCVQNTPHACIRDCERRVRPMIY